ncbi:GGDEF domain-containing protein [Thalassospira sp. HF15]|uniref:GGDEF domain-containing protein n=1 Tax=Thalassospira sp. HF15 TaxID=2722755 RepID=UPI0014302E69|nr:GGDEF domain-containing protein [Thalassospira sp. HF15]NIY76710.1 GGDEF domain-containing protein [Thalassospira sp. HF15]
MPQQEQYRQRSRALSRETLDLITELGLSANPINFAVFFAYVEKSNDDLVALIDILRSNQRDLDDLKCHELYQRFIEPARVELLREAVSNDLQRQLSELISSLSQGKDHINADALRAAANNLFGNTSGQTAKTELVTDNKSDPAQPEVTQLLLDLEEMKREAHTDGLTGIANRKAFDESLRNAAMATMEGGDCLSVLLIDIDHFKRINDTYGHQAGDQVIRTLAKALQQNVKGRDTTARYGGEEFAVILPATAPCDAMRVAENIRCTIEQLHLKSENRNEDIGRITASIGVATYQLGEPLTRVIERADKALYLAKANGRNCVMSQDDLPPQQIKHAQSA